jgi:hypothetical protein
MPREIREGLRENRGEGSRQSDMVRSLYGRNNGSDSLVEHWSPNPAMIYYTPREQGVAGASRQPNEIRGRQEPVRETGVERRTRGVDHLEQEAYTTEQASVIIGKFMEHVEAANGDISSRWHMNSDTYRNMLGDMQAYLEIKTAHTHYSIGRRHQERWDNMSGERKREVIDTINDLS